MRMNFIRGPIAVERDSTTKQTTEVGSEAAATISMHEAAAILGVNVKTLYAEAKAGRFPVLRIGRKMLVSRSVLESILARGSMPR
jgi:excisionase family DNA binding protein